MDPLHLAIAFLPLGLYLLVLGAIHFAAARKFGPVRWIQPRWGRVCRDSSSRDHWTCSCRLLPRCLVFISGCSCSPFTH